MEKKEIKVDYREIGGETLSREFYGFKDTWGKCQAWINTEYQISLDTWKEYTINRSGDVLKTTSEIIPVGIIGKILLRPHKVYAEPIVHSITLFYSPDGSTAGASVNPGKTRFKVCHMGRNELDKLVDNSFPYLHLLGEVTLSTTSPLPGDTSKVAFSNLIVSAIKENSEFSRLAKAHKSFLDSYLDRNEVRQ